MKSKQQSNQHCAPNDCVHKKTEPVFSSEFSFLGHLVESIVVPEGLCYDEHFS